MSDRKEDDSVLKEKRLEGCLKNLVADQLETYELWEIDDGLLFLFDLTFK
jgi:hypothetical protein